MVLKPTITCASLVWWSKTKQTTVVNRLGMVQRLAYLAISRKMRTAPTSLLDILLTLTHFHLVIMEEARMTLKNTININFITRTCSNDKPGTQRNQKPNMGRVVEYTSRVDI